MATTSTKVQCTCYSKKETTSYSKDYPNSTSIELQVPYDQNSIYYQLSGGSNFTLNTINKDAADMFVIGEKYDIIITPSTGE